VRRSILWFSDLAQQVLPRPSFPARRFLFCSQFLLSPSSGACSMLTLRPHAARFCFSLLLPGSVGSFWFLGPCRSDLSARLRFPGRRSRLDFPRLRFWFRASFRFLPLATRARRPIFVAVLSFRCHSDKTHPAPGLGLPRSSSALLLVCLYHRLVFPLDFSVGSRYFGPSISSTPAWLTRSRLVPHRSL
jgi:hypothetical protein